MGTSKFISSDIQEEPREPRILIWDIETAPTGGRVWSAYDANLLWVEHYEHLLTVAWKWLGETKVHVAGLNDYEMFDEDPCDDYPLVALIYDLFSQADVLVAHNGIKFDTKKAKGRMLAQGFEPVHRPVEIDTLRIARQEFNFVANSLNWLSQQLNIGSKVNTGGIELWYDIEVNNDPKAWARMKEYNKHDVELLEELFLRIRPWSSRLPNMATLSGRPKACPLCGDDKAGLQARGNRRTAVMVYTDYRCNACKGYSRGRQGYRSPAEFVV